MTILKSVFSRTFWRNFAASAPITLWTLGMVVYRIRYTCVLMYVYIHITVDIWVGVAVCLDVHACVYRCLWSKVDHRFICVLPNRGLDISAWVCWVCVTVCILCMDYSSTSPSLSGDGQIKLSSYLKDFNFINTFLGFPGDIQSGNILMSSLWVVRGPEVANIQPCIYTSIVRVSKSWSEESPGVGDALRVCWCPYNKGDLLVSRQVEFVPNTWGGDRAKGRSEVTQTLPSGSESNLSNLFFVFCDIT